MRGCGLWACEEFVGLFHVVDFMYGSEGVGRGPALNEEFLWLV